MATQIVDRINIDGDERMIKPAAENVRVSNMLIGDEYWSPGNVQTALENLRRRLKVNEKAIASFSPAVLVSIINGNAYPVTYIYNERIGDWDQVTSETAIEPEFGLLYADIATMKLYMWNGTSFSSFG